MAFIPAKDTYYRIYFKHSGKCLTVKDGSPHRGAQIVQKKAEAQAAHQLFQIRLIAEDHFAITAKNSGHNLDVPGATHDNGARLIQWDRGEHQWHQRFRFVRVGDGFYKMQAVHSGKYMVVNNGSHDDNADVIQWSESNFDHAIVRMVPDGAAFDSITGRDFVNDSSELMRTAVIGIVGLVPEVGSIRTGSICIRERGSSGFACEVAKRSTASGSRPPRGEWWAAAEQAGTTSSAIPPRKRMPRSTPSSAARELLTSHRLVPSGVITGTNRSRE